MPVINMYVDSIGNALGILPDLLYYNYCNYITFKNTLSTPFPLYTYLCTEPTL